MGKYLDMIRQYERTQPEEALTPPQVIDQASTVNPGDQIEWQAVPSFLPPLQPTWRELARMTAGLEQDDPRLGPVLSALAACEAHDKAGDPLGFEHAAQRVQYLMQCAPGAQVRWRGREGHHLTVLGPAMVEHVHCADNQLWVYTDWHGIGRWVPERSIVAMGQIDAPALSTNIAKPRSGLG